MGILTGSMIRECVQSRRIKIDPFNEEQLNPNSYNLHIGNEIRYYSTAEPLDSLGKQVTERLPLQMQPRGIQGWLLTPGRVYLASTVEKVGTREFIPQIDGRSGFGRLGATAHVTAGFGDIGFASEWTLEIVVAQPIILYPFVQYLQVYFETPEGKIDRYYDGSYKDQIGPTESRLGQSL